MNIKRILITTVLIAGTLGTYAQQQNTLAYAIDTNVKQGQLPNGFKYYIRRNVQPAGRGVFYLVNKVGSILERDDQRGLAHFLEHMSFNGTKHFPDNQLLDYLQKAGVRFGADINAYTSYDETIYQLPIPLDKPEVLVNGIQILRDWAQDVTLDSVQIDKERGVILEELRMRKGAMDRLTQQTLPLLLNNSKYVTRSPIGTAEIIQQFPYKVLKEFYSEWYRPNLQALIAVGDFDPIEIEKMIKAKFSDLKNPVKEAPRPKYTSTLPGKNQFIALEDPELADDVIKLYYKHMNDVPDKNAIDYKKIVTRTFFSALLNKRFQEYVKRKDAIFKAGGANLEPLSGGLYALSLTAPAKPNTKNLEKTFKGVWRETQRIKKFGFTAEELAWVRKDFIESLERAIKEEVNKPSESYAKEYIQVFKADSQPRNAQGKHDFLKAFVDKVTLEDLNAYLPAQLETANRDIVMMRKSGAMALPKINQDTIEHWMKEVESESLEEIAPLATEKNAEEIKTKSLLSTLPVPGKIVAEDKDVTLGTTTLTFANGVKAVLKPTNFKKDEIVFVGVGHGGISQFPKEDYYSAASASRIMSFSGIGNFSAADLQSHLSGTGVSASPFLNGNLHGINGRSNVKGIEKALQLIYAYHTFPRKDEEKMNSLMKPKNPIKKMANVDPMKIFKDTVLTVMANGDERKIGESAEKLEKINLDRAYEIYFKTFQQTDKLVFTFVGDLNIDSLRPLLLQYLGSLPKAAPINVEPFDDFGKPKGKISKTVYSGLEEKSSVLLCFTGPYETGSENSLELKSLEKILQYKMTERLREKEGGVYSPKVQSAVEGTSKMTFTLEIAFGCAPENVEKLISDCMEEIDLLKKEGPSAVDLQKTIAENLSQHQLAIKTNSWWLTNIAGALQREQSVPAAEQKEVEIKSLNVNSLKNAASKYLSGENLVKFILYPAKNNLNK